MATREEFFSVLLHNSTAGDDKGAAMLDLAPGDVFRATAVATGPRTGTSGNSYNPAKIYRAGLMVHAGGKGSAVVAAWVNSESQPMARLDLVLRAGDRLSAAFWYVCLSDSGQVSMPVYYDRYDENEPDVELHVTGCVTRAPVPAPPPLAASLGDDDDDDDEAAAALFDEARGRAGGGP